MKKIVLTLSLITFLTGCVAAGSAGRISRHGGLEATCGGGCATYKSDGTGCAAFNSGVSDACADYFTKLCAAAPQQCVN